MGLLALLTPPMPLHSLRPLSFVLLLCLLWARPSLSQEEAGLGSLSDDSPLVDIGSHKTTESPFGTISVGVSQFEFDSETRAATGRLEFGYVFQIETNHLLPRVIEMTPFYVSEFSATQTDLDWQVGDGIGYRTSFGKRGSSFRWLAQITALFPQKRYLGEDRSNTELELLFGAGWDFGGAPDFDKIERLRALRNDQREFWIEISEAELHEISTDPERARSFRIEQMLKYFEALLNKRRNHREDLNQNFELSQTDLLRLVWLTASPGEKNKLEKLYRSREFNFTKTRDLVEASLGTHLLEVLRDEFRLRVELEAEPLRYCVFQVRPFESLDSSSPCGEEALRAESFYEDFIDAISIKTLFAIQTSSRFSASALRRDSESQSEI